MLSKDMGRLQCGIDLRLGRCRVDKAAEKFGVVRSAMKPWLEQKAEEYLGSDASEAAARAGFVEGVITALEARASKDEVIAKWIRGVSGQRWQDVDTIAALSTF